MRFTLLSAVLLAALAIPFAETARAQPTGASPGETAPPTCAVGNALLAADQFEEARKAFVEAMSETTSQQVRECARQGIQQASQGQAQAEHDHKASPSWSKRVLDWAVEALVAIGLALCALLLALQVARFRPIGKLVLRLPGLGRLVSPRLSLETIGDEAVEGKPGVPTGARIKKAMREARDEVLAEKQSPYDLEHVSARQEFADLASDNPTVKSGLEKASGLSEQTKLVAALLGLLYALLPIRRFTLSIALSPPTSVAEATLLLEGDARLEATISVSAAGGGKAATAADYVHLAIPAAVWTEYEVARILAGRPLDSGEGLSYVALREGVEQSGPTGDLAQAKASFQRALAFNWRNWAAYMGLATIEEKAGDFFGSLATLEYALKEMQTHYANDEEEKKKDDDEREMKGGETRPDEAWSRKFGPLQYIADANYYRIGYRLASCLANAKRDDDLEQQLLKRPIGALTAEGVAKRLLCDADMMVRWCRRRHYWSTGTIWPGLKPSEERLWHFLTDVVRPGLRILLATELAQHNLAVAKNRIKNVRNIESADAARRGKLVDRTYYNLACFEASSRSEGDATPIDRGQAIEDLKTAVRKAPGQRRLTLLTEARADPFLKPLIAEPELEQLLERFGAVGPPAKARRPGRCRAVGQAARRLLTTANN